MNLLHQVRAVVKNQAHLALWHGVTQSLAFGNQFLVSTCLVAILKERYTGIRKSLSKPPKSS
jgi:hypothetical protein